MSTRMSRISQMMLALILGAFFSIYKLWGIGFQNPDGINPDWLLRVCIVVFFCSWLIGSLLDVPFNNRVLISLGIRIPITASTLLVYGLMMITFCGLSMSSDISVFCGLILILVIIEMTNLHYIDTRFLLSRMGYSDGSNGRHGDRFILESMHVLFCGMERKLRNFINVLVPLLIAIEDMMERLVWHKETVPDTVKTSILLVFIIISESWMMKIRIVNRKQIESHGLA